MASSNIPSISFSQTQTIDDLKYELTHILEPIKLSIDQLTNPGDAQAVSVLEFRHGILSTGERVGGAFAAVGAEPISAPAGTTSPVTPGLSAEDVAAIIADAEQNLAPLFDSLNSSVDSALDTLNNHTSQILNLEATYGDTLSASQSAAAAIIAQALAEDAATDASSDAAAADQSRIEAQAAAEAAQTAIENGVAMDDTGGVSYGFETTVEGWTATSATITWTAGGFVALEATGTDPDMRSPSGLTIDGAIAKQILVRLQRTAGSDWEGAAYYTTSGHGFSDSFKKTITEPAGIDAGYVTIAFDMDELTAGGTDWEDNTITQIRLDLASDASTDFEVTFVGVGNSVLSLAEASAESASAALASASDASSEAAAAEISRLAAESAQLAAEDAETDAEAALASAVIARDASVQAQTDAETAEANASSSESIAVAASVSAGSSASDASASAGAASGHADTASANADAAGGSATAAQIAQVAAQNAQGDAEDAASAAATSESTATTAAGDAAQLAADADLFAQAAQNSATSAATSESNASTFASDSSTAADDAAIASQEASNQASAAAGSAIAASLSESAASDSEIAAAQSETVAALWGDFSTRLNTLATSGDQSGWSGISDGPEPLDRTVFGRSRVMLREAAGSAADERIESDGFEMAPGGIYRVTGSFAASRDDLNVGISFRSSLTGESGTWDGGGFRIKDGEISGAVEASYIRVLRTNKQHDGVTWYDFEVYIGHPDADLGKFPKAQINGESTDDPEFSGWAALNDGAIGNGAWIRMAWELLNVDVDNFCYLSDIYVQRIDSSTSIVVQEEKSARITADGLTEAEYTVKIETLADGNDYIAGFGIAVQNGESGPTSQALFNVDTFAVTSPDVGGLEMYPFIVDSGVVFIDSARVNDLRSQNYVPGVDGWALDRTGNFEANEGLFRGNLTAGSITTLEVSDASITRTVQAFHDEDQQGQRDLPVSTWVSITGGSVPITAPVGSEILANTRMVISFWVQITDGSEMVPVLDVGDPPGNITEVRLTRTGGNSIVRQRVYSGVNQSFLVVPVAGTNFFDVQIRVWHTSQGGGLFKIRDAQIEIQAFYR